MSTRLATLVLAATVLLTGCDRFGQAMTAHTDVVARAAGHQLTVKHAAALMNANSRLPEQPAVVQAVANIWTDYTLLATAMQQDSTLKQVDLTPVVQPQAEQEMVTALRDKVIHPDTAITDSALRTLYEQQQPDAQVRARHILIRVNSDATQAQRDSALALAQSLDKRAKAGEDFAKLAEKYSQDPGSAKKGGDLGWFGHGQMVGPFEDAAFKLKVGQVSDVVQTPFGYHIIKLEGRKSPKFDTEKAAFKQRVLQERERQAEQDYVQNLLKPLNVTVQPGAYDVAREMLKQPDQSLSDRAAGRALVKYQGGTYSAKDFMDFLHRLMPQQRSRYLSLTNDQMEQLLKGVTTNRILIAQAKKEGLGLNQTQMDSLKTQLRLRLVEAAKGTGLADIKPQQGETQAQAIDRRVDSSVQDVIEGHARMLPLGPISYVLREKYGADTFERAFPAVVTQLKALRAQTSPDTTGAAATPATPAPPAGTARPKADTSGSN